jgi:hypothetical protein
MSFLRLVYSQFNVYNNSMVRLTFTASTALVSVSAAQSFPVPSFPQILHSSAKTSGGHRHEYDTLKQQSAAQQGSGTGSLTLKTWRKYGSES